MTSYNFSLTVYTGLSELTLSSDKNYNIKHQFRILALHCMRTREETDPAAISD